MSNYWADASFVKLPEMAPFPAERSVLVLDNCRIHHNEALVDLVKAAGETSPVVYCKIH